MNHTIQRNYLPNPTLSRTNSSIDDDFLMTLIIASQTSDPWNKKKHCCLLGYKICPIEAKLHAVANTQSDPAAVSVEVAQSSTLGSLLFIIHINDLAQCPPNL